MSKDHSCSNKKITLVYMPSQYLYLRLNTPNLKKNLRCNASCSSSFFESSIGKQNIFLFELIHLLSIMILLLLSFFSHHIYVLNFRLFSLSVNNDAIQNLRGQKVFIFINWKLNFVFVVQFFFSSNFIKTHSRTFVSSKTMRMNNSEFN